MTRVKQIALTLAFALAVAGSGGGTGKVSFQDTVSASAPAQQLAGDPSQWGVEGIAKKGSFDITELNAG